MDDEAPSEEDSTNPTFTNTHHLLQSLSKSISNVQILKGKWSLISTKLTALQTHLSQIPSSTTQNPLSSDLLLSLSATLTSTASLAALCHSPSPPNGKLKTQNDVDSISASLDSHISDLELLLRTGAFSPRALPATGGKRESVRVETRNLMTRLQIGSTDSKNSAIESILGLLQEDDKNVLIAVAQGIVPVLVRLLDSTSSPEIKEKTVAAIAKISTVDSGKHLLLAEGLVLLNNLLRVLDCGSVFAKEKACVALKALSRSKENARAIGSRGGICSLLEICGEGTPNSQALAAGVLRDLSLIEEIKEDFIDENAVETLLALCNSGTVLAQENSIGCLCNLISGNDDLKIFFASEGGIESIKNFWDSSSPNAQSLEVVVEIVRSLASCTKIVESLVSNGFLNRICLVLDCGILGVRTAAAKTVYNLAYNSRSRKEIGEMGCISTLVRMLDGKSVEEKEAAAKALSMLMNCVGNRRIFRKEEKGIVFAVRLLDPLVQNLDKKYPVMILNSLVCYKKCRKQMVVFGACAYVQKLVDKDVEGAKKLLDSIRHGKIWGVFNRS